jgi:hypothetical protein
LSDSARGPVDHDELKRRAGPPEQRRRREGDLPQPITPQQRDAVRELADQVERVLARHAVVDARVGNVPVEDRGDQIDAHDHCDRGVGRRVDRQVDHREIEAEKRRRNARRDQRAAEHEAEDDGAHGGSFHPSVRNDQLLRRQQLGEDAVLRRRVGRGAEAHHRVGQQRMHVGEHHRATDDLDRVRDQHHVPLRHRIGECADERGEDHVGDDEALLQRRRHPRRLVQLAQQRDRGNEQRVVGERREELRRDDRIEAGFHRALGADRGLRDALAFVVGCYNACLRGRRFIP